MKSQLLRVMLSASDFSFNVSSRSIHAGPAVRGATVIQQAQNSGG